MEEQGLYAMPMIGDTAPSFRAVTTQGEIRFPEDYQGKWVVLFSFPMDFTPVCTTELMTFASVINEFRERNVEIIGLSIASVYSHIAWLRKMKELSWKDMKHLEISFPLIADVSMEVTAKYGMLHANASKTQTVRAVYVIDPNAKIRSILYYPFMVGRNIAEIKRLVIALQMTEENQTATPADWMPGDDVILPPPNTCDQAAQRMEKVNENMYCLDWFLAFKQSNCEPGIQEAEPEINLFLPAAPIKKRKSNIRKNQ